VLYVVILRSNLVV